MSDLREAARALLDVIDRIHNGVIYWPESELLRAALAAEEGRVSVPASDFEKVVEEFVDDYVFEGDQGTYTPNEHERALLVDFGHGLIALMEDSDMLAAAEKESTC